MIAENDIEQLIRSKQIAIAYSFAKLGSDPPKYLGEQYVDFEDENSDAVRMFRENFFADRSASGLLRT
ncbi:MAG: hypothetical protein WAN65_19025 [Candidatus Sulfotelmatobacter sp.]